MSTPFSVRIFVADGDPDGLRIVERSNWIGKALVFPRALLPQVKQRPELAQTGVYLLLGPRQDGEDEMLHVGEGDPIRPRLESHYAQKDFWTRAIGFTTATVGQLNKAHVQFLEARLLALAKAAKRVPLDLDNKKFESEPTLSEADRADMEVFLANRLGMLPVLGVHAFEQAPAQDASGSDGVVGPLLYCRGKGVEAKGYESTKGFVILKGSRASAGNGSRLNVLREDLVTLGVLVQEGAVFRFSQDFLFRSPSSASGLVLDRSSNGRIEWKDAQGRTLKELQQAEAGS